MNHPKDLPTILPVTNEMLNRRRFLRQSILAGSLAAMSAPAFLRGANLNSRVDIAVIGAGGKGSSDTDDAAKAGGNIVALCDVDMGTLNKRGEKYPSARKFQDYRKLFSEMGKSFDAVIVATPDHHHAYAAAMAMRMGKHAFVQKPLTHSVWEARLLRRLAKENKIATQMGNQGSAGPGLRRAVEVIQKGLIGQVRELHVWSNRPIWPQGQVRPAGEIPVPDTLDWDVWIGPAPMRPYNKGYHPFAWRGIQDFGTGALGDMACHTVNMPFRALKLGYPSSVEAKSTGINAESWPLSSQIRFEFPRRAGLVPCSFTWYDGKPGAPETFRPSKDITADIIAMPKFKGELPGSGCLLIGDKGRLFAADDYGATFSLRLKDEKEMVSADSHPAVQAIPVNFPKSPGHYVEWIEACKGGSPAYSNFEIAAYLTEIILLGCVSMRAGKKLEWDGPKMKAKNIDVAHLVKRDYRKGWEIPA